MTGELPRQGGRHCRERVAAEIDRVTVVAEAKVLVRQLDTYLELMGEWITEEMDRDVGES